IRRLSSRLTSGRNNTPRTRVKMAAFAPMPSAKVKTTVMVRPLVRASERIANFIAGPPWNNRLRDIIVPETDVAEGTHENHQSLAATAAEHAMAAEAASADGKVLCGEARSGSPASI